MMFAQTTNSVTAFKILSPTAIFGRLKLNNRFLKVLFWITQYF